MGKTVGSKWSPSHFRDSIAVVVVILLVLTLFHDIPRCTGHVGKSENERFCFGIQECGNRYRCCACCASNRRGWETEKDQWSPSPHEQPHRFPEVCISLGCGYRWKQKQKPYELPKPCAILKTWRIHNNKQAYYGSCSETTRSISELMKEVSFFLKNQMF